MRQYDFHNILSPDEFELLARDILEIKYEHPFRTFTRGKDNGIDIEITNGEEKWFAQVKRIKDRDSLFRALEKEVPKVLKLNPNRYIIVTSVDLSVSCYHKIMMLFKGYIREGEDIIDRIQLNKLLGSPRFHSIEIRYNKLWITSSTVLVNTIKHILNKGQHNKANKELREIENSSKKYVHNPSYERALEILKSNRLLIISGTPGIGKTTLARELVAYYLSPFEGFEDFFFISQNVAEAFDVYDGERKQIFFYDDFLGKFTLDENRLHSKELIDLNRFIEDVSTSKNSVFILTTRDYVLKQGEIKFKNELRGQHFITNRVVIKLTDYTPYIKAKILYNHLYFSKLDKKFVDIISRNKNYEKIIRHPNYTPRLVDDFINKDFIHKLRNRAIVDSYDFLFDFEKYLDNPYEFWLQAFEKLTRPSQLILLITFTSCEPIPIEFLSKTFDSVTKEYLSKFNDFILSPDTFQNSLKELHESFISIDNHREYYGGYVVSFQTPWINDFLLKFLRTKPSLIEILIKGAKYFNQLDFVFSTRETEFSEYEDHTDHFIHGKCIKLTNDLIPVYESKFLSEFDQLTFSNVSSIDSTDEKNAYHSIEEIEIYKLVCLCGLFDLEIFPETRAFVVERFNKIIGSVPSEDHEGINHEGMIYFASLSSHVFPYMELPAEAYIKVYFENIRFANEYHWFTHFGEKEEFKEVFQAFVAKNKKRIQNHIKELIIDDIDYYAWEALDVELDTLLDYHLPELEKEFDLPRSKRWEKRLKDAIQFAKGDRYYDWSQYESQRNKAKLEYEIENQQREQDEKLIEHLYLSFEEEHEEWFDDIEQSLEYLREIDTPAETVMRCRSLLEMNDKFAHYFESRNSLSILLLYVSQNILDPRSDAEILTFFIGFHLNKLKSGAHALDSKLIERGLMEFAYDCFCKDSFHPNVETFTQYLPESAHHRIIGISQSLEPILKTNQQWISFSYRRFTDLLVAQYVSLQQDVDNFYLSTLPHVIEVRHNGINNFLEYCSELDKKRFARLFALPILTKFKRLMETDSDPVKGYFKGLEISSEYEVFDHKLLIDYSESSSCDLITETVLEFYGIDLVTFYAAGAISFGDAGDIDDCISEEKYSALSEFLIQHKFSELDRITIDYTKWVEDSNFLNMLEKFHVHKYIHDGYRQLCTVVNELEHIKNNS